MGAFGARWMLSGLLLGAIAPAGGAAADDGAALRALRDEVVAEREALAKEREALAHERQALADQRLRVDDALAELSVRNGGSGGVVHAAYAQPAAVREEEPQARLDVYGYLMLDAIYDTQRVDPDWTGALRPSKIPVNCGFGGLGPDPGCGENGETTLSARQSRLGFKGYHPTSLGELRTIFEFELFGVGDDAGETTFRLRHAWGELGQLGAGQTWSLFMDPDVFPNTIEYWGPPGMAFLRNPQVRWTPVQSETTRFAVALEAPGSGFDQGKIPEDTLGGESWTEYPDLTSHVRYGGDWGHVQLAGILRFLGVDGAFDSDSDTVVDSRFREEDMGFGVNLTSVFNVLESDWILAGVTWGEGISNYMNDGGSDIAPDSSLTRGKAVESLGFLLYYNRIWNDRWSSSFGYSEHKQDNTGGQTSDAFRSGRYASANALFRPVPELLLGPEVIWAQRENNNGDDADDMRVQMSFKYSFDGTIVGSDR
jgi:hypothetical protein